MGKKKRKKLCTDEVGEIKMKKNSKKHGLQSNKTYFLYYFFLLLLWLCISKMNCKAWEGIPILEKNWERSTKVFGDRLMLSDGPIYPIGPASIKNHYDLVMS